MANIRIVLNGDVVNPFNLDELTYSVDFTSGERSLKTPHFDMRENALVIVKQWVEDGKVLEGIPIQIFKEDSLLSEGFVYADEFFEDHINCVFEEVDAVDWLENASKAVTYATLYDKGVIKDSDFISVEYKLNPVSANYTVPMLFFTGYVLTTQLLSQLSLLESRIVAVGSDPLMWGDVLAIAVILVAIGVLLVAMFKIAKDLYELLIQGTKIYHAMYWKTLLEKGAEELGLGFSSPILDPDLIVLPTKFSIPENEKGIFGYFKKEKADKGYFNGTFYDMLSEAKKLYNAELNIRDNVLYLEQEQPTIGELYQLEPLHKASYKYNTDDFISNMVLSFTPDQNDKNTIVKYKGTSVSYRTEIQGVSDKKAVFYGTLEQVQSIFSRGVLKDKLTVAEEILLTLYKGVDFVVSAIVKVVNAIIKVINGVIRIINKILKVLKRLKIYKKGTTIPTIKPLKYKTLASKIEDNIGLLVMDNDFVLSPKLLKVGKSVSMEDFSSFHERKLFDPVYNINAQKRVITIDKLYIQRKGLDSILKNKKAFDIVTGKDVKVNKLTWNLTTDLASIEYDLPEIWSKNLQTIKTITDEE